MSRQPRLRLARRLLVRAARVAVAEGERWRCRCPRRRAETLRRDGVDASAHQRIIEYFVAAIALPPPICDGRKAVQRPVVEAVSVVAREDGDRSHFGLSGLPRIAAQTSSREAPYMLTLMQTNADDFRPPGHANPARTAEVSGQGAGWCAHIESRLFLTNTVQTDSHREDCCRRAPAVDTHSASSQFLRQRMPTLPAWPDPSLS